MSSDSTPIVGRCVQLAPFPGPHLTRELSINHRLLVAQYRAKVANGSLISNLVSLQSYHDDCLSRAGIAFLRRADDYQRECSYMQDFWRQKKLVHSLLMAYQVAIHDCEQVDVRAFSGGAVVTEWMEWMESCWALVYSLRDGYGVNVNTCHVLMCEQPFPCVEGAVLGPHKHKWYDYDEQERLNVQHSLLNSVFDQRQIFPPLVDPEKILDCGVSDPPNQYQQKGNDDIEIIKYGSGAWAVEGKPAFKASRLLITNMLKSVINIRIAK
ncbi:MAG: hypothetical protein M1812_006310 [Candelaria pacifica]|nr:MAG: hypothetical protein M1812_006310 [Candelaria pacifica]